MKKTQLRNLHRRQGLSSGQSAAFCLVSSATIVNWIKAGKLVAQRTVGGQYRIARQDLRRFMLRSGMQTDTLDAHMRPFCWEILSAPDGSIPATCETCPVRLHLDFDCFRWRTTQPSPVSCQAPSCSECAYGIRWSCELVTSSVPQKLVG